MLTELLLKLLLGDRWLLSFIRITATIVTLFPVRLENCSIQTLFQMLLFWKPIFTKISGQWGCIMSLEYQLLCFCREICREILFGEETIFIIWKLVWRNTQITSGLMLTKMLVIEIIPNILYTKSTTKLCSKLSSKILPNWTCTVEHGRLYRDVHE